MKVSSSTNIQNIYREQLKKVQGESGDAFKKVMQTTTAAPQSATRVTLHPPSGVNVANPVYNGKPAPQADPVAERTFAAEVVATQPEVRSEKIERLKALIDKGQYNIPASAVAERLMASGIMKSWEDN